jgi:hypothetical protein
MKTIWTILLGCLLSFVTLAAAPPVNTNTVTLAWQYPSSLVTTDLFFQINLATNVLGPWAPMTNFPATNAVAQTTNGTTFYTAQFLIVPSAWFFDIQAGNLFWGLSPTSSVASTPPAPILITNLAISRP